MDKSDFDKSEEAKEKARKKQFQKSLGQKLRRLRESKALRQDTVCIAANLSTGTLAKIEAGSVSPEAYTLFKIAKVLKTPLAVILTFKE
jgi:transcriptional regulator with XRE-family HTH domain